MVEDYIKEESLQYQMDEVMKVRYEDCEKVVELCRDIINKSGEDYMYGKAFGEYFYAEACYRLNRSYELINHAIIGLTIQKTYKFKELEARSYNLLGVYFVTAGDFQSAISYYMAGTELAKEQNLHQILKVLYNNIGDLYLRLKDYEKAIYYFNLATSLINEYADKMMTKSEEQLTLIRYCNLIEAYLMIGKKEEAIECAGKLIHTLNEGFLKCNADMFYSVLTRVNYACGKCEQGHSSARMFIDCMMKKTDIMQIGDTYLPMCEFFLKEGLLKETKITLDFLATLKDRFTDPFQLVELSKLYVEYYKSMNDTGQLFQAYEEYYKANLHLEMTNGQEKQKNIQIQMELYNAMKNQKNMMEKNRELEHLSEHDALTGLANRYSINKYCDQMFEEACRKDLTFGVIIVDIDYFKEFNDTYGHIEGDRCICNVAHMIEECADGLVTARFGGDEFLVMTIGQSNEKLEYTARMIRKQVEQLHIIHEGSLDSTIVTVSQGIVNSVPEKEDTLVDYIRMADIALYKVKKSKRNTYGFYAD